MRWSLIKAGFSRRLEPGECIRVSRKRKRERGIWQRRYGEHQIRDEADLARHIDYIHFNPVRHGWISRSVDCPYSTVHGYIEREMIAPDWGGGMGDDESGYGER